MKKTKRKAFNFLRSYFDVLNELPKDKDKLDFLLAIINKQFLNEDPTSLSFIPNLCYESQRHAIETSVNGWERATKETLGTTPPTTPPTPNKEEEEKEKEKEKEEVQEKEKSVSKKTDLELLNNYNLDLKLKNKFLEYFNYRKEIKKPLKTEKSKILLIKKYKDNSDVYAIIDQTIMNGWQGLFESRENLTQKNNNKFNGIEPTLEAKNDPDRLKF